MGKGKSIVKTDLVEKYSFSEGEANFFLSYLKERHIMRMADSTVKCNS